MSPGVRRIGLEIPSPMTAALSGATVAPDSQLVMILAGIQAANPSKLKLPEAFSPLGVDIIEAAWNNQPVHHLNDTIARLFRLKGPILNSPPKNWTEWATLIDAGSAANRKPVAPVLVCEDTFDGGTVVPVPWQTAYAASKGAVYSFTRALASEGGEFGITPVVGVNAEAFALFSFVRPHIAQWLYGRYPITAVFHNPQQQPTPFIGIRCCSMRLNLLV